MKEADGYKQHIITCGRQKPVNLWYKLVRVGFCGI